MQWTAWPPRTPTRRSRLAAIRWALGLIRTASRTGYRWGVVVTDDPTQNRREDAEGGDD